MTVDGTVFNRQMSVGQSAHLGHFSSALHTCAADKDTSQVLCYVRNLAKGEVVGLKTCGQ